MNQAEALFAELERAQRERRLPPVQSWQPTHSGVIDIRIARDGQWFHEGRPILRQPLVDLFATVLRREGEQYFLVTPGEKLAILVEDAPFVGVALTRSGSGAQQRLLLSTNTGDHVQIDAAHALQMRDGVPYVVVRDGLCARLTRAVYYQLVDFGEERDGQWCVVSAGETFALGALVD